MRRHQPGARLGACASASGLPRVPILNTVVCMAPVRDTPANGVLPAPPIGKRARQSWTARQDDPRSRHRDELRRNRGERRRAGAAATRRKSSPTSCSARSRSMRRSAAWCPRSRRAPMSRRWTASSRRRLPMPATRSPSRRHRGDGRSRPRRRADRRADDGQGDGRGGRQAADRGQPSRRPRADGAADRWAGVSLSAAAGFRRPYADRAGARRRRLPALGDDHRRRAGRGLRQDREDAGPSLSGRAECREGRAKRRCHAASPSRGR